MRIKGFTCRLTGDHAIYRVSAWNNVLTCEQYATTGTVVPATRTTSPTTVRCHWCLPRWSALWVPHQPAPGSECHQSGGLHDMRLGWAFQLVRLSRQSGGIARHEAPTRRRHTPGRLRVVHNPHHHRRGERRRDPRAQAGFQSPGQADTHGRRRHHRQPNVARHLSRSFFEMPHKRCNSNDTNSMFE